VNQELETEKQQLEANIRSNHACLQQVTVSLCGLVMSCSTEVSVS